jgi:hypothetical protein
VVYGNPQGLESASGRVYLLMLPTTTGTALNEFSQFSGRPDRLPLFSIFNYSASDPSRVSLFTELKNYSGDFRFGKDLQEIGRCLTSGRVHPHI